jgi:phosphopantothenoylcysteine decarboxylase / phosphopantothenate---cysteine ligase
MTGRLLLIVSGGIAAYKAPDLVRKLIAVGFEVQVVVTEAALGFCTELSLATVSARPVRRSLLDPAEEGAVGHIELADWPDLILVAPATADLLARAAHGLANDLASTVLLASRAPVLWAPAMNTNMWRHPATQANLAVLAERNAGFVGPDRGELACGWIGEGRMIDPPILADAARAFVDGQTHPALRGANPRAGAGEPSVWRGRKLLVTAGPTRAYLDPVRFISNASTGAMGFAIAAAGVARGAEVTLVAGPVGLATPPGVRRIDVETGAQMLDACDGALASGEVDLVAMVAAVADLLPAEPAPGKLGKAEVLDRFAAMQWRSEVDILATLVERYGQHTRFLGFAAQTVDGALEPDAVTEQLHALGAGKLTSKGCDALFVNRVGVPGLGFASSTNAGLLLFADAPTQPLASGPAQAKAALAGWLLDQLGARLWPTEAT